jgi:hypothetical protein
MQWGNNWAPNAKTRRVNMPLYTVTIIENISRFHEKKIEAASMEEAQDIASNEGPYEAGWYNTYDSDTTWDIDEVRIEEPVLPMNPASELGRRLVRDLFVDGPTPNSPSIPEDEGEDVEFN